MKKDIMWSQLDYVGDIHVMVNLLSDVGFKREWVKNITSPNQLELVILDLITHYKGTREERLRIFHLIQIWGGYSGRNIYLNYLNGFEWDIIDPRYELLVKACRQVRDITSDSIRRVYDAVIAFDKYVPNIGVSFITKHTRFWLFNESLDTMLPIYDSVMRNHYFKASSNQNKDLLPYWEKFCSDRSKGERTLAQYERDLYNQYKAEDQAKKKKK